MENRAASRVNWLILGAAIVCEVTGSMALKQAEKQRAWFVLTLMTEAIAFWLLAVLLKRGMPLSVVYGIWGALGVALTALLGTILFHEPFTALMGCGIVLVVAGVLCVESGSADEHVGDRP